MLTVHHLGKSQSERIVWLCEELDLPYELVRYDRDPVIILAPAAFKALHPIGAAPILDDGGVRLAESGAIVDYVLAKYGEGRLVVGPDAANFADYLHWLHFANGTLQPSMGRMFAFSRIDLPSGDPMLANIRGRLDRAFAYIDARLQQVPYLAGQDLTAADIMSVFSLTTMRAFQPVDLAPYPGVRAYLQRIGARPAYQRAMAKGDPGMPLLLS